MNTNTFYPILIIAICIAAIMVLLKSGPALEPELDEYESEMAAEPSPDQWQTQPEKAKRAAEFLRSMKPEDKAK